MSELKRFVAKKRISELESRVNNLHQLVDNIAFNQSQIIKAMTANEDKVKEVKEVIQLEPVKTIVTETPLGKIAVKKVVKRAKKEPVKKEDEVKG